jgi:acetyl esterase
MTRGDAINPQAQAVLDGRNAAGVPPICQLSAAENRAAFEPVRELIGPGPAVASVSDLVIPGQAGQIPARVYSPVPPAESPAVIVYYHGGGWVIGSVDDWDAVCRALAVASGCTLVSVDYRLAPENRFPAAADDAFDAYTWAAGPALGAGKPMVLAGDSAGGNLAAVTALRARQSSPGGTPPGGVPLPVLQVLVYPVVDCDLDRKSMHEYGGTEFIINGPDMEWFWDQYLPDPAARRNPYASPLRAPSLTSLPPAYVVTAEHDPLRDEGFEYVERLRAAGVPVTHRHYGSQIHGFYTMVNVMDDADRAVADTGRAIRQAAGAHPSQGGLCPPFDPPEHSSS